jgi:hypothetical protein
VIYHNSIQNNTRSGLVIYSSCENNSITKNDYIENNISCQVYDDGKGNLFDGNFFSNWNAPDRDRDSIVDFAYPVAGESGNSDWTPKTLPNCDLPGWYKYKEVSAVTKSEPLPIPGLVVSSIPILIIAVFVAAIRVKKKRANGGTGVSHNDHHQKPEIPYS